MRLCCCGFSRTPSRSLTVAALLVAKQSRDREGAANRKKGAKAERESQINGPVQTGAIEHRRSWPQGVAVV